MIPDHRLNRRFDAGFSISPSGDRLLAQTATLGLIALCEMPHCDQWTELTLPDLSWSPDGKGVTYLQNSTIVEQPLAGGSPRIITRLDGQSSVMGFSRSPDGSRVAFTRGWYPNDMVIIKGLR